MSQLPNVGDLNWGPELNDYITNVVLSASTAASAGLLTHETATDPHADRAYANSLIAALNAQANLPGGYVQLNSQGFIPPGLVHAGGVTNIYDVVADYGATGNGTTDDSAAINSALAAANAAGGGQVWVPSGTYAIGTTLVIGANTWLHLDQGAVIKRIANPSVPTYMLANFTPTSSPGAQNILVTGGAWTVGTTSQKCVVMAFIDATNVAVGSTTVTHSPAAGSTAVLFAGCSNCAADQIHHKASAPAGARNAFQCAAIQIEASSANVIPGLLSGVYTNQGCRFISITNHNLDCDTDSDGNGPYCIFPYFVATFLNVTIGHSNVYIGGCKINACAVAIHVVASSWSFYTCTGNQITNCGPDIPTTNITNCFGNGTNTIQFDFNTWFDVTLLLSWSGKCKHKRADVNNVQFSCTGVVPGTLTDGSHFCTIPYTLLYEQWHVGIVHRSGGTYVNVSVKIDVSGNMYCYGFPSDAIQFHCNILIPLDRDDD